MLLGNKNIFINSNEILIAKISQTPFDPNKIEINQNMYISKHSVCVVVHLCMYVRTCVGNYIVYVYEEKII